MLFRLVRPVKRHDSRNPQFVQRIPADVRSRATGLRLDVPVGDTTVPLTISAKAKFVRLSLRTSDPSEVKVRQAAVATCLENVWQALRVEQPISLTHKQATALAGEIYRAWADEDRTETTAIQHVPEGQSPVCAENLNSTIFVMPAAEKRP